MRVDHARHDRPAASLDHLGPGLRDRAAAADLDDDAVVDQHRRVLDRIRAGAVDQHPAANQIAFRLSQWWLLSVNVAALIPYPFSRTREKGFNALIEPTWVEWERGKPERSHQGPSPKRWERG